MPLPIFANSRLDTGMQRPLKPQPVSVTSKPFRFPDGSIRYLDDDGRPHRIGAPAIVFADGSTHWLKHGNLHRDNGPAVENADGTRQWWQHGLAHRLDGPAWEWANGRRDWFIRGRETTEQEVMEAARSVLPASLVTSPSLGNFASNRAN